MIDSDEKFLLGKYEGHLVFVRTDLLAPHCSFYQPNIKWKVPASFFRLLLFELSEARVFERFILCLTKTYNYSTEQDVILRIRLLQPVYDVIDYKWNRRIGSLLHTAAMLEFLFWSLSTLGGAVSAMADYVPSFIDKARIVSFKQLDLARHIGNPLLISRCYLFIAMSLAQKGHYKIASEIVRQEFKTAKRLNNVFLLCCCEGVWSKVKALKITNGNVIVDDNRNIFYSDKGLKIG